VWREMKAQRAQLPELNALLDAAPAALGW
jgi:hypothetical protein